MSQWNEKGVSNDPNFRGISNKLDANYFNNHPGQRHFVHGVYHDIVGAGKYISGNKEGANAEWKRANDHYNARHRDHTP